MIIWSKEYTSLLTLRLHLHAHLHTFAGFQFPDLPHQPTILTQPPHPNHLWTDKKLTPHRINSPIENPCFSAPQDWPISRTFPARQLLRPLGSVPPTAPNTLTKPPGTPRRLAVSLCCRRGILASLAPLTTPFSPELLEFKVREWTMLFPLSVPCQLVLVCAPSSAFLPL